MTALPVAGRVGGKCRGTAHAAGLAVEGPARRGSTTIRAGAAGNYTQRYFEGEESLIHRSLRCLEERLDPDWYFWARRQHIFNFDRAKAVNSRPNGKLAHISVRTSTGSVLTADPAPSEKSGPSEEKRP